MLIEPVHEVNRVEVAPAGAGPHHIGGDGGSEVRLAGARPTDQHDVVPVRNKLAAVQRAQQSLIDWGASKTKASRSFTAGNLVANV